MMRKVPKFLLDPADQVAPRLLGWHVVSRVGGVETEVRLTEVEAYLPDDPASHAFGAKQRLFAAGRWPLVAIEDQLALL